MQADALYFNLDSPKFGTIPKNGSTEIGTQVHPKTVEPVDPKTVDKHISTYKEQINTCMHADAVFFLEADAPAKPKRKALTHKFKLETLRKSGRVLRAGASGH